MLPDEGPGAVEGAPVVEASDADNGYYDHADAQAEKGGKTKFLAASDLNAPEQGDGYHQDYVFMR